MEQIAIAKELRDERCGLFIMAGLDHAGSSPARTLTIHAAAGALREDNITYINNRFRELGGDLKVRIRIHSSLDLHEPGSLEGFANLFEHETILADPTGAFTRVSALLELARLIRSECGEYVQSILWQPHASTLVVTEKKGSVDEPVNAVANRPSLEDTVASLVERIGCPDLKRAIKTISSSMGPTGRYTPVDRASRPIRANRIPASRFMARLSSLATLIGLGTFSAAQASLPPVDMEDEALTPGIVALVDLTTLGETSYGVRNPYQAIGGLRLYFGASGMLQATAIQPGNISEAIFRARESAVKDDVAKEKTPKVLWQVPKLIVYGD